MPLTLRDLVADTALGLRTHAGGDLLDRNVTWVHVSELDDPTPFLEGGELLLTTGLRLAEDADHTRLIGRLIDTGVAGLGFGTGLSHDDVPATLVEAARDAGLPLLEIPRRTPFIAISKAVSEAIAADAYADLTRTSTAQQELTRAAVSKDGPAAVVRRLAKLLDAWVVLLDAAGETLHMSPARRRHPDIGTELDRLRGRGGPASASFTVDNEQVTIQSLGREFLAVGRARPLDRTDQHVTNTAASLLTLALARTHELDAAQLRLRTSLFRLLLAGEPDLAQESARALWGELPSAPLLVHALTGPAKIRASAVELLDAELGNRTFFAEVDEVVLVLAAADEPLAGLFRRLPGAHVGVSDPVSYHGIAEGRRQAAQAAESAQRSDTPLVRFADLAGQNLLALLPADAAHAFADALLAPLRRDRGDLEQSLRVWLSQHGQWDPAAARLGVHRHTLRNRMRKVEELTGRSLDSPGFRAELWIALNLAENDPAS